MGIMAYTRRKRKEKVKTLEEKTQEQNVNVPVKWPIQTIITHIMRGKEV